MTLTVALVFLMMVLPVGCGNNTASNGRQTRIITDQAGRQVELPEKVTRVDTSYRIATEIIIGLGAGDTIVGTDASSSSQSDFFSKFLPDFAEKPNTGSAEGTNTEQIAALKPDVIIVSLTKGPGMAKIEQLEAAGLTVVGIDCESLEELAEGVRIIGSVVGAEDKAREYIDYYERTCDMIRDRLADLDTSERVPVYISGSGGILSSCGSKMYQSSMIELAGGINVAASIPAGGWALVSAEQLIRWDPSYIFAVQYGHSMSACPATPQDIMSDSRFSTIDAIKNGRVYMFPSNISAWDYPSMQAVLGLLWTAKTLHPEKFEDVNMTQVANDFYLEFFNKSFEQAGGCL